MTDRDTAPQPPGEFAHAITAGLIEKRARYIRQLEDRSRRQRLDLKEKSEFIVKCKDRIAALESQLAEAQARLAMAVEALEHSEEFIDYIYQMIPLNDARTKQSIDVGCEIMTALTATAPAVAEFVERVERRGAVKELRRMAGQVGNQFVGTRRYSTPDLLARAEELEVK